LISIQLLIVQIHVNGSQFVIPVIYHNQQSSLTQTKKAREKEWHHPPTILHFNVWFFPSPKRERYCICQHKILDFLVVAVYRLPKGHVKKLSFSEFSGKRYKDQWNERTIRSEDPEAQTTESYYWLYPCYTSSLVLGILCTSSLIYHVANSEVPRIDIQLYTQYYSNHLHWLINQLFSASEVTHGDRLDVKTMCTCFVKKIKHKVHILSQEVPGKKASKFYGWFVISDNQLQYKK
jgi:hypothetical protein